MQYYVTCLEEDECLVHYVGMVGSFNKWMFEKGQLRMAFVDLNRIAGFGVQILCMLILLHAVDLI